MTWLKWMLGILPCKCASLLSKIKMTGRGIKLLRSLGSAVHWLIMKPLVREEQITKGSLAFTNSTQVYMCFVNLEEAYRYVQHVWVDCEVQGLLRWAICPYLFAHRNNGVVFLAFRETHFRWVWTGTRIWLGAVASLPFESGVVLVTLLNLACWLRAVSLRL